MAKAWFTYHGLTKEQVDARVKAYVKIARPPLVRGEESSKFYPDKLDDPDVVDMKRENYKKWCEKETAAYRRGVEAEAKQAKFGWAPYHLGGVDRAPPKDECEEIVFKAGEPVLVEDDHWIYEKVNRLASGKNATWSKSDEAPAANASPAAEKKPATAKKKG